MVTASFQIPTNSVVRSSGLISSLFFFGEKEGMIVSRAVEPQDVSVAVYWVVVAVALEGLEETYVSSQIEMVEVAVFEWVSKD